MKKSLILLFLFILTLSFSVIAIEINANGTSINTAYGNRNGFSLNTNLQVFGQIFNITNGTGNYDIQSFATKLQHKANDSTWEVQIDIFLWNATLGYPTGSSLRTSQQVETIDISTNGSRVMFNFSDLGTAPFIDGQTYIALVNTDATSSACSQYYKGSGTGGGEYNNGFAVFKNDGANPALAGSWLASGTASFNSETNNDLDFDLIVRGHTSPTPTSPFITLQSQSPANISSQTLFVQSVNLTYNYTNSNSWANQTLNYSVYGAFSCNQYLNGTCLQLNNTIFQKSPVSLTNGSNFSQALFSFSENDIYTSNANLNYSLFSQTHSAFTLTTDNYFLKTEYLNITTTGTTYNILELMVNTTGISRVYACNSTYTTGSVLTSPYCQEIGEVTTTTYNHTHTGGFSQHNLIPFVITNGRVNAGITATSTMFFIVRGSTTGTAQAWYIPNASRTGATETSINSGVTWTPQTYNLNTHLHTWSGNEYLRYQAQGTNGTELFNSSQVNELIDIAGTSPAPPILIIPLETIQSSQYLNITWSLAQPTLPTAKIQNYTLTLLNADFSVNRSVVVVGNSTTNYLYNLYVQNLSLGSYYIKIVANDTFGATSSDEERFNLTRNALLNISAFYFANGVNFQNLSVNFTNINTSETGSLNTTNGTALLDIVNGYTYQFLFDITGYALTYYNYSANQTSFQKINVSIYTDNSVFINIYDETTLSYITENVTIVTTGAFEITNHTTNGTFFLSGLPDNTYTIKLSSANYTLKTYTISVSNRSTQILNAYLSSSTSTTIIQVYNENTGVDIEGVFVNVEKIISGNYTTIESKYTDITGRVQIVYTPLVSYRFTLSHSNYTTKQFVLNPILFSTYAVAMTPSTTANNTYDYDLLSLVFYPKSFYNGQLNNLTFIITSPLGYLSAYNFSAYYKGDNKSTAGNNAYGQTLTLSLNITNALFTDKVIINYSYVTTTGGLKKFSQSFSINGANNTGNYTIAGLKSRDYGLGLIEKAVITLLVVVIISGFAYYVAGIGGALTIGLLIEGVAVYLGFLPLASVLISFLVGLALVVATSTGGNK